MGAKIEIFADDSADGKAFVKLVENLACPKCEVIMYNLNDPGAAEECEAKAQAYGITSYPAAAMNGKLVDHEKLGKADGHTEHGQI